MPGFIDIHCHVLPMVDDGAQSTEMALDMLRIAADEGIWKMILTPHQKADRRCVTPEGIVKRIEILQKKADELKIPVKLFPGNEIFYRHGLAELLEQGKIRTLANSHYVLIEFLPGEDYAYIRDAIGRVASFGYWPVVAHVERYVNVIKDMEKAERLKEDAGCYFQVNASSVVGEQGFAAKNVVKKLLKAGLVDFVGTDAHSDGSRAPRLRKCAGYLEKKYGETMAGKLMRENAEAILEDRVL
ncbi:hypothetical protein DXC51_03070 [Eisenbergiella massiliensis]|uniref:protein-tyrosine-phosphatase n=2 Tax=Eisenbergiella massiliensis TaxID=1720294 RepID=A0A3E3IBQ2_9FIRM|nr:hypothetical protein DXC51_03070 [Eisenbergiella massiliensis]